MTYGEQPNATRVEAWLEERLPGYRYGTVLILLAMTFVVMAAGPPDGYTRVTTVVLQGLTLMAALLASRVTGASSGSRHWSACSRSRRRWCR